MCFFSIIGKIESNICNYIMKKVISHRVKFAIISYFYILYKKVPSISFCSIKISSFQKQNFYTKRKFIKITLKYIHHRMVHLNRSSIISLILDMRKCLRDI